MAKVYDVAAVIGEKRDGKPLWKTFGIVFETEKGLSLKLDSMPIAKDFDGWFKLFPPSDRAPARDTRSHDSAAAAEAPAAGGGYDDQIPFAPRHWQS